MWGEPAALLMVHVPRDGGILAVAVVAIDDLRFFQAFDQLLPLLFSMDLDVGIALKNEVTTIHVNAMC